MSMHVNEGDHQLVGLFTSFYQQLAQLKSLQREGELSTWLLEENQTLAINDVELSALVQSRLLAQLQQQAEMIQTMGSQAEVRAYRMAQYVMAVLADEILLLECEWQGKGCWTEFLLETQLFNSATGGEGFYHYLDKLLSIRLKKPVHHSLAAIFLMALQLGFRGQFRGALGAPVIEQYRQKLGRFLGTGVSLNTERLFRQAYQGQLGNVQLAKLRPMLRWWIMMGAGAATYLIISSVIWLISIQRIQHVIAS
ncbi:DotU family type IV/VI secretion system protein [Zooshikella sp. RANM57]|uniref:DotU family type IV/VI secretion system protein n=1 Tax=Zooshikella sp. RANM57 TaxID=3425863 RepID=UPI003D6E023B